MNWSFGFLFLAETLAPGVVLCCCSPYASVCCAFRDAALYTLVLNCVYLSYDCLSITSKLSGFSPLTSGNNKVFSPRLLYLAGYYLYFRLILCKS